MPIMIQSLEEWAQAATPDLLSVIIPAHNEEGCIEETIRNFETALSDAGVPHEILVINDNSSDRTEEILKSLESELPSLSHINNEPPNGFGFAVRVGLTAFKGECVALVMADGSDDPKDLVKFYRKWKEGYDCVFGTRFHRDSTCKDYPLFKLILNRIGNLFIKSMFLMGYNDTTNAFKLYSRDVIAGLQPLLSYQFNLTVELPLKAISRGFSYAVVPNNWYNRTEGVSKFRVDELGSRYIFIVLYCWLEKQFSKSDYVDMEHMRHLQLQVWHR